ncbi:arginine N-methyltransferase 7 [Seminavis robusta]|uniref:Arginine N-methyltransferase 7 n=1 Tax=Seminavis robusta TaxID=568900 RepID=A0A9N8HWG0_9STRA|nr:arginine N-methyltransferase 7 [Seminavis robusta]|eukprot:Sro1644_g288200.1 arginine N-methyltransferase 7 (898) ;mRNA; r:16692-19385
MAPWPTIRRHTCDSPEIFRSYPVLSKYGRPCCCDSIGMTDNAEVSAAIAQSRYNETVVLQVVAAAEDDDKKPREILLIACLDKDSGGIIWKDLSSTENQEEEDGVDVGIVRHLRTKQWFFPMLNDHRRNELYDQAIRAASKQAVRQFLLLQLQQEQEEEQEQEASVMRVLDIGSGTGLLAMMAAKYVQEELHNNKSKSPGAKVQVTSLEMSAAMSRLARLTIADNQLHDTIQVSEGHSTEHNLSTTSSKIQFCVSELLESSLLQEGILPALRDAWERQLHPTAVMVPQRARVLGQLVEGSFLKDYWGPHGDDNHNNSIRLCLSSDTTSDNTNNLMRDGGARGGFILPIHAEQWIMMTDQKTTTITNHQKNNDNNDNQKLKPLSDPFPIMNFDFSKPGALPGPQGRRLPPISIQPHTDGRVHAVLFWWELNLWQDLTYSTQHGREPWQDHWHQCLFVFTSDKDGYPVQSKTPCQLVACHNDTAMWFSMVTTTATNNSNTCDDVKGSTTNQNNEGDVPPPCKRMKQDENNNDGVPNPAEMPEHNPLISSFRACQLNNSQRQAFLQKGIRHALHEKGKNAVVLDVSDFALCAILAAKMEGATRVSSLESSTGGVIPTLSAKVAQLANGLPSSTANNLFQVLQCHAEQLSLELLNGMDSNNNDNDDKTAAASPVQIVVGEPYYQMLEGWHLQEALNYFYLVRALQRRGILADNFCSVPAWAVVKGCAIESASLKQAYGRCGGGENGDDKSSWICGFDHQQANCHGDRFHQYDLCLPMWEYEYRELTASFEIARLDYNNNGTTCTTGQEQQYSFSSRAPFLTKGTCHSVLVWVEYGVRVGKTDCFESHATLGRSYRQLVRMLRSPVVLDEGSFGQQELLCRFEFGNQKDLESYKLELSIGSI